MDNLHRQILMFVEAHEVGVAFVGGIVIGIVIGGVWALLWAISVDRG